MDCGGLAAQQQQQQQLQQQQHLLQQQLQQQQHNSLSCLEEAATITNVSIFHATPQVSCACVCVCLCCTSSILYNLLPHTENALEEIAYCTLLTRKYEKVNIIFSKPILVICF